MRKNCLTLLLSLMISATAFSSGTDTTSWGIIPKPVSMKPTGGTFTITSSTQLVVTGNRDEGTRVATWFAGELSRMGGPLLAVSDAPDRGISGPVIVFSIQPRMKSLKSEGYELIISPRKVTLTAAGGAGLFRGMQTLLQLLPAGLWGSHNPGSFMTLSLPGVKITDYPRYPYRGMHLDVSRHFFSKEFVKHYIDLLAFYKMNTFHWHLTDDNGWRIEIRKYPELMNVAAWHVDREELPWGERPAQQPGEKATYGGYYTQADIREIVRYAADRYITVIPEIEMPAHSVEVLAAYPRLSCTGGPFTVPPGSYWPNSDILCAGNDSVFTFLEDVLTEVMELFPSKYIHIGGDEADKTNWKKCPKCQERIRKEGLKDEKELQSYFIRRIEQFVTAKGRRIIGWDEILEGGLAPEATVMSWRGLEGGIAAARMGHDAIMTPTSYCYLDYYQADPDFEPKAIGGFITLKKVYSYNPTPDELTAEEARHILGAQGNLWTEFIPSTQQVEYMAFPRMIALAEVTWTPQQQRGWDDFRKRLDREFNRLDAMKLNYSKGSFKVSVNTAFDAKTKSLGILLGSEQANPEIRYTIDGSDVTATSPCYTGPITMDKNGIIRAGIFCDGKLKEKLTEMPLIYHHAVGRPVSYLTLYSSRYPAAGKGSLTDGLRGTVNHRDGMWQGYLGNDLDLVIDLGEIVPVNAVQMNFLQNQRSWIYLPQVVEYSLSPDGKNYHSFNEVPNKISPKETQPLIQPFNFQFMPDTKARYIRVRAKNLGKNPDWHEGAGEPCWMFTDEVVVF